MAQSRRKRQTKHRGNAAGTIESRGRTSRPERDSKGRVVKNEKSSGSNRAGSTGGARGARQARPNRAPSWKSAAMKAGFMAALLFLFANLNLFGKKMTTTSALILCLGAFALYVPLSFFTDRAIYRWRLKKEGTLGTQGQKR